MRISYSFEPPAASRDGLLVRISAPLCRLLAASGNAPQLAPCGCRLVSRRSRSVRPVGYGHQEYGLRLRKFAIVEDHRRAREISPPGCPRDLRHMKHQMRMPVTRIIVEVPILGHHE